MGSGEPPVSQKGFRASQEKLKIWAQGSGLRGCGGLALRFGVDSHECPLLG